MTWSQLLLMAVLAESIWQTLKMVWQKDKLHPDILGALIVGVILAMATGMDIFQLLGIPVRAPYLGEVFTGILASRGANFIHDLMQIAQVIRVRVSS